MSGIPEDINVKINIRRRIGEYEHLDMTAETILERGTPWEAVRAVRTKLALALDPSLASAKPAEEPEAKPAEAPKAEKRAPGTVVVGPKPEAAQEAAKAWDEAEEMKAEVPLWEAEEAEETEDDKRAHLRELVTEASTTKGHEALLSTLRPIAEAHGVVDGGQLPIGAVNEAIVALNDLLSR